MFTSVESYAPEVCNFQCYHCSVSAQVDQLYAIFDCNVSGGDVCQWLGVDLLIYCGNVYKRYMRPTIIECTLCNFVVFIFRF
jgi:hypothetical protein